MSLLERSLEHILAAPPVDDEGGILLGSSRGGRPLLGWQLGRGPSRISLLAGCHADEPVGPRLLRKLVAHLRALVPRHPLLERFAWWIVPHVNPDGEERNRSWQEGDPDAYDLIAYLRDAVREPPGDDIEFGFPVGPEDEGARPENLAVWSWWRDAGAPFHAHVSLHGMAFGGGPWFLVEPAWQERSGELQARVAVAVERLGYRLHDVERRGEKGFFRIARGFATRPDSRLMQEHFLRLGDGATAALFRPSSMEAVRALGGDPLTLVTEMPLFITPGVGEERGPPDQAALEWRRKIDAWRLQIQRGRPPERIRACSKAGCLEPMPVKDQMLLQWLFVAAGIELAERAHPGPAQGPKLS